VSFGLSAQFGVCFLNLGTPVHPLRLENQQSMQSWAWQRSADNIHENRYSIGRLMSPRDEAIDLDEQVWSAALAITRSAWRVDPARLKARSEPDIPNGPAIRKVRGFGAAGVNPQPDKGMLALYALDPQKANAEFPPETPPIGQKRLNAGRL
jgi:hypothetical protein